MDTRFIEQLKSRFAYERSRVAPPTDFPDLPPIPGGRYTDPDFLALETRYLWRKSWLYACHVDELPHTGSFMTWEKSGSPIVIVRAAEDQFRAYYNVCRHRGGPLVTKPSGLLQKGFSCRYHGWQYNLDGTLKSLRDRRDFGEPDMSCLSLVSVRCERFGCWVFVNEDPAAQDLGDYLGPVAEHWQHIPTDRLRHFQSYGFDIECNVKVMLEAFFEVYHLGSVHAKTANRFLDHAATCISLWPNGHSLMVTPNRSPDWVDPGTIGMDSLPGLGRFPLENNLSYNVYPNLVTPIAPTGFPFLTFWPTGPRTMRVECHWFAPEGKGREHHPLWGQRIENFNRILDEDMELVPQIQRSLESPGFQGARLNYQERRIYHWHEELDRRLGQASVPDGLRLEPRLSRFVEQAVASAGPHPQQSTK